MPGELHERPWVNFGHNRTEALELARGQADLPVRHRRRRSTLQIADGFELPRLTRRRYYLRFATPATTYARRAAPPRRALPWRWEGVLHEYVTCCRSRSREQGTARSVTSCCRTTARGRATR